MEQNTESRIFFFLTEERKQAIRSAIHSANRDLEERFLNKAHIYAYISPLNLAFEQRGWLIGHLKSALTGYPDIVFNPVENIESLQFDNEILVYFRNWKKRPGLTPNESKPPDEPTTLRSIRAQSSQRYQLSFLELSQQEYPPPGTTLGSLRHVVAAFVIDQYRIKELYFLNVNRRTKRVVEFEPLDLSVPLIHKRQQPQQIPESEFKLKPKIDRKANTA